MARITPTAATVMAAHDAAVRASKVWARAEEHAETVWTMEAMKAAADAKKAWRKATAKWERMARATDQAEA